MCEIWSKTLELWQVWRLNWITWVAALKWSVEYWNTGYMMIGGGWVGAGGWHLMTAVCFSCFYYSYFCFFGLGILNYDCMWFWTVFVFLSWSISCNTQLFGHHLINKYIFVFCFFPIPCKGKRQLLHILLLLLLPVNEEMFQYLFVVLPYSFSDTRSWVLVNKMHWSDTSASNKIFFVCLFLTALYS